MFLQCGKNQRKKKHYIPKCSADTIHFYEQYSIWTSAAQVKSVLNKTQQSQQAASRNNLLEGSSGQVMGHQISIAVRNKGGPLNLCQVSVFVQSNSVNKSANCATWQDLSWKLCQTLTYVVPDVRKGVRTPSTRTMFFTPGRAKLFLLFVWTKSKKIQNKRIKLQNTS